MSTRLQPGGEPVVVEGVRIVSPGLRGRVEVLPPDARGLRSADAARPAFVDAIRATGMREQRTIVISDHSVDRAALGGRVTRSTEHGEPGLSVTVPGPGTGMGQVMLAADEAGVLQWVLPDDVPASEAATRGGDSRTYTVPLSVASEPASGQRGLLAALGKKVLKVLAFKLLDRVAGELANRYAQEWEKQAHPHRLRLFGPEDYSSAEVAALTPGELAAYAGKPTLLFVHGTMSLSHSGFRRLPAEFVKLLHHRYEGRVLAFDHPTVSVTPTENARWLAELLAGAGLHVDVIAHSRGGLVSRVLAEQPDLIGLRPGSLEVRQLVMVGTPNQGTALADADRLRHLANRVTNLLELLPDNAVTDVVCILLSVVKQLAVGAFSGLDGIMAMAPGGPWLSELNQPRPVTTTYRAIASNYEPADGSPIARLARDRVTDLVFKETGNDLIVPEAGVYASNGASNFAVADPLTFLAHQSVDHSSYWTSGVVQQKLGEWLVP